MLSAYKGARC